MTFYKATRPDGTDFRTGTVDYGGALKSGETLSIPEADRRITSCGAGVLHASDEPAETLIGGSWPCRLFIIEGEPVAGPTDAHKHKLGFHELRVVEEVEAWRALGPNGREVAALIERTKTITPGQAKRLAAAWDAARAATWAAARAATWDAARAAARDAAWDATWAAARAVTWDAARAAARDAAWDAALALTTRDLITEEQFNTLYGPWAAVMDSEATG